MNEPALRFGTYCEFQCPPGRSHAELIWDVVACGEQADRLGFDVFTCLEHPFFEKFAINVNPLALFCTLAQRTSRLRFRALCHTLPLHNPMVLAGEIAQADILLDGRLDVGVGRGHAWLNAPANVPLEENVERYAEALDILIKAWTHDRFSYEGKHYTVNDLQVVPKPLQRPHPPIYQVGTSAKWFRRAAENGYGITLGGPAPTEIFREPARLYRRLCHEVGTKANLSWMKAIYLDENEARAHAEARQVVVDFIRFNVDPMDAIARATAPERQRLVDAGYAFYAETDYELLRSLSYEQLVELGIVFVGTPAQVGERLAGLWHEFGFHELLVIAHFGGMQRWQALKNQELFARDVMPMLRAVARPLA